MIKSIKKKDSLIKIALLTCLFLTPLVSFAEINAKNWVKECTADNKNCLIAIRSEIKSNNSEKAQILATALIKVIPESLIKKAESIFTVHLPFNVDLRLNPLIVIDGTSIANLTYTHCNAMVGCTANITLSNDVVNIFKKGKELIVIVRVVGKEQNKSMKFPLKNFSSSYKLLIK